MSGNKVCKRNVFRRWVCHLHFYLNTLRRVRGDVTSLCARDKVTKSVEDAQTLATSREGQARAKYSFTAQTGMELSFRKVLSGIWIFMNKSTNISMDISMCVYQTLVTPWYIHGYLRWLRDSLFDCCKFCVWPCNEVQRSSCSAECHSVYSVCASLFCHAYKWLNTLCAPLCDTPVSLAFDTEICSPYTEWPKKLHIFFTLSWYSFVKSQPNFIIFGWKEDIWTLLVNCHYLVV